MSRNDEQWYREMAKASLHRDGELEFDDDAAVSCGGDNGAYVQCWAWVDDDEQEEGDDE